MSNRHWRRLQQKPSVLDATEDINQTAVTKQAPENPRHSFSLLLEDELDGINFEEDSQEMIDSYKYKGKISCTKKKKSGRKKIKMKETSEDDDQDIEKELQFLTMTNCLADPKSSKIESKNMMSLYPTINIRLLNYHIEEYKIYGKLTPLSSRDVGYNTHQMKNITKYSIINPKNSWYPYTKSGFQLVVERQDTTNGLIWVKFVYEKFYSALSERFWEYLLTNDTTGSEIILAQYPYHVETLLQFSDIYKTQEDYANSSDFVERALYSFECCKNQNLVYGSRVHRLSFRNIENRLFYQCLYRHSLNVALKGFHSTALELMKLIYSLDPQEDPMGVLMVIDRFFLQAKKHQQFLDFVHQHQEAQNLKLLPNISFSLAYSYFILCQPEKAAEQLREALIKFPMFLKSIRDVCNIEFLDRIENHRFFNFLSFNLLPPVLDTMVCFYAKSSKECWKNSEVGCWLMEKAEEFLNNRTLEQTEKAIMEFRSKRRKIYKTFSNNMLRAFHMNDYTNTIIASYLNSNSIVIFSVDPFPSETQMTPNMREIINS